MARKKGRGRQASLEAVEQLTLIGSSSEPSTVHVAEGYTGRQYITDLTSEDPGLLPYDELPYPDSKIQTLKLLCKEAMTATKRKFDSLLSSITSDGVGHTAKKIATASAQHNNTSERSNGNNGPINANQATDDDSSHSKRRRGLRPFSFASAGTSYFVAGARDSWSLDEAGSSNDEARNQAKVGPLTRSSPNFVPWDRQAFLERLKTFAPVTSWGIKPEQINEVHWAKRGWSCVSRDRVRCKGGCEKEIYIQLFPDDEDKLITLADEDEAEWSQAKSEFPDVC